MNYKMMSFCLVILLSTMVHTKNTNSGNIESENMINMFNHLYKRDVANYEYSSGKGDLETSGYSMNHDREENGEHHHKDLGSSSNHSAHRIHEIREHSGDFTDDTEYQNGLASGSFLKYFPHGHKSSSSYGGNLKRTRESSGDFTDDTEDDDDLASGSFVKYPYNRQTHSTRYGGISQSTKNSLDDFTHDSEENSGLVYSGSSYLHRSSGGKNQKNGESSFSGKLFLNTDEENDKIPAHDPNIGDNETSGNFDFDSFNSGSGSGLEDVDSSVSSHTSEVYTTTSDILDMSSNSLDFTFDETTENNMATPVVESPTEVIWNSQMDDTEDQNDLAPGSTLRYYSNSLKPSYSFGGDLQRSREYSGAFTDDTEDENDFASGNFVNYYPYSSRKHSPKYGGTPHNTQKLLGDATQDSEGSSSLAYSGSSYIPRSSYGKNQRIGENFFSGNFFLNTDEENAKIPAYDPNIGDNETSGNFDFYPFNSGSGPGFEDVDSLISNHTAEVYTTITDILDRGTNSLDVTLEETTEINMATPVVESPTEVIWNSQMDDTEDQNDLASSDSPKYHSKSQKPSYSNGGGLQRSRESSDAFKDDTEDENDLASGSFVKYPYNSQKHSSRYGGIPQSTKKSLGDFTHDSEENSGLTYSGSNNIPQSSYSTKQRNGENSSTGKFFPNTDEENDEIPAYDPDIGDDETSGNFDFNPMNSGSGSGLEDFDLLLSSHTAKVYTTTTDILDRSSNSLDFTFEETTENNMATLVVENPAKLISNDPFYTTSPHVDIKPEEL